MGKTEPANVDVISGSSISEEDTEAEKHLNSKARSNHKRKLTFFSITGPYDLGYYATVIGCSKIAIPLALSELRDKTSRDCLLL